MLKQWSLETVHLAHGYDRITGSNIHQNFRGWIESTFGDKKIKIIDIGGGNGRVCLEIMNNIEKYWCLDLNKPNIRSGEEFFKMYEDINFIHFDIDEEDLTLECEVVYIDSVLTMLEKPFENLLKCSKVSKYIFVNRTRFSEKTEQKSNTWAGMSEPSVLWTFDFKTIADFCLLNNLDLTIHDNISFVIKIK